MHPNLNDLVKFIDTLSELPAELLEFRYEPEAFGSWEIKLRTSGKRFRLLGDGREGLVILESSNSRKLPDTNWSEIWQFKQNSNWQNETLSELSSAIQNS